MKEAYIGAEQEIVEFQQEDVVTASGTPCPLVLCLSEAQECITIDEID